MSATIVFSHANGFPAGTYRLLFEHWRAAGWRVEALPRFGHDPHHPVSSNWPHLRDELIEFITALRPDGPVHLVGHSLGGFLSLLAACRRPELARSVVLIDSPLVTGWRAHSVHVVKLTGLMARVSPGRIARRRRQHWPSRAEALAHFSAKSVFARWQPEVLADYVECGTEPAAQGGVQLSFRREIEARIYDTLPHHLSTLLRRHPPRCPVAFLGGTRSAEVRQVGLGATRRLVQERLRWIEGGHLFPMEQPQQTAQAVLDLLPR
ncbi:MAG: hypothetical protein RJA44_172 [Pseudomonadota bacterium]